MNSQNQYPFYPGYLSTFLLPPLGNLSEIKREETPVKNIYNDPSPILRAPEIKQEEVEYNDIIKEELSHPFYITHGTTIKEKLAAALECINAKKENGEPYNVSQVAKNFNLNRNTLNGYILRKAPHLRQRTELNLPAVNKKKLNAAVAYINAKKENGESYAISEVAQDFNLNRMTLYKHITCKASHLIQHIPLYSRAVSKKKLNAALAYINDKKEKKELYIVSQIAKDFNLNKSTLNGYILRKAPHLRQRTELSSRAVSKKKLNAAVAHIESQREKGELCNISKIARLFNLKPKTLSVHLSHQRALEASK